MILYKNCRIITMSENMPTANYMVVEDGRITGIGTGDAPKQFDTEKFSEIIDLNGNTVIPGFWESHLHIVDGTRNLIELNLRGCNDLDSMRHRLAEYRETLSEGDWIIGHGWDEKYLFNGSFPDRQLLDGLCREQPMMLIRMDGHSLCINTRAMELLGSDWIVPSPEVPMGEDGLPTGMVYENAANNLTDRVSEKLSDDYLEKIVLKAQQLFVENGISSVNDICTAKPRYFDMYQKLYGEGKLKIRITASANASEPGSVQAFEDRRRSETSKLKIGSPKCFMDGSFGSRTALLFEEYSDEPGNCGLELIERGELARLIADNAEHGRAINIHAIGDKAVANILDAYEKTDIDFRSRNIRGRIEHIQVIRKEDIKRFRDWNITASFQPVFLYEKELTAERLGKDRLDRVYLFKTFMDCGVNVVLNSDWPYGGGEFPQKPGGSVYIGFEPLLGLHSACCNQFNSSEELEPLDALKGYTINPAYVNHREAELGKLEKGYLADFVVLSRNISEGSPQDMIDTEVLMTVVNGEILYAKITG